MTTPIDRTIYFSPDRAHRYTLWRTWGDDALPGFGPEKGADAFVLFVMLNPSVADEVKDDNTIRRCRAFAEAWGYAEMCVANLFAFRATKPEEMKASADPVGPENDRHILRVAAGADKIVVAWGEHGIYKGRGREVAELLQWSGRELLCLRANKDGSPGHPLYVPDNSTLTRWHLPELPNPTGRPRVNPPAGGLPLKDKRKQAKKKDAPSVADTPPAPAPVALITEAEVDEAAARLTASRALGPGAPWIVENPSEEQAEGLDRSEEIGDGKEVTPADEADAPEEQAPAPAPTPAPDAPVAVYKLRPSPQRERPAVGHPTAPPEQPKAVKKGRAGRMKRGRVYVSRDKRRAAARASR